MCIMQKKKDEYVALIQSQVSECEDIGLLDLILKLLEKSSKQTAPKKEKAFSILRVNPYQQSQTMQLIGNQNVGKYTNDDVIMRGLKNIANARAQNLIDPFEAMFDCFIYGTITGKREERAKKKATI